MKIPVTRRLASLSKVIAAIALSASSLSAWAEYNGRYLCPEAVCFDTVSPGFVKPSVAGINAFLQQTDVTPDWQLNDVRSICDGMSCVTVVWRMTAWVPFGPPYKDPKSRYKN